MKSQPLYIGLERGCFLSLFKVVCTQALLHLLQGAVLQSSDRGGIRIQYSKNPFGKKRDHQGNPVDPQSLPPGPGGVLILVTHINCLLKGAWREGNTHPPDVDQAQRRIDSL